MKTTLISGNLAKFLEHQWQNAFTLGNLVTDVVTLPIDYSIPYDQRIIAGNYAWKEDLITENKFPIIGEGIMEYEFCYIQPDRNVSSETAVEMIEKKDRENPWEPARTEHALAFGENFPEEQCNFPIVALGSVGDVDDYRSVLCLDDGSTGRSLGLVDWDGEWSKDYRFLAVRKVVRI